MGIKVKQKCLLTFSLFISSAMTSAQCGRDVVDKGRDVRGLIPDLNKSSKYKFRTFCFFFNSAWANISDIYITYRQYRSERVVQRQRFKPKAGGTVTRVVVKLQRYAILAQESNFARKINFQNCLIKLKSLPSFTAFFNQKELSFCHKLKFSAPFIFTT